MSWSTPVRAVSHSPVPTATPSPTWTPAEALPGDINRDQQVNAYDVFLFAGWWQDPANETNAPANAFPDAAIDDRDLLNLLESW